MLLFMEPQKNILKNKLISLTNPLLQNLHLVELQSIILNLIWNYKLKPTPLSSKSVGFRNTEARIISMDMRRKQVVPAECMTLQEAHMEV